MKVSNLETDATGGRACKKGIMNFQKSRVWEVLRPDQGLIIGEFTKFTQGMRIQ